MKIYTIMETAQWNENPILIGLFHSRIKAVNEVINQIISLEGEISTDVERFLLEHNETQGLEVNYIIEEKETNEIFN